MKVDFLNTKKKYNVFYADPAWEYKNKKTGGGMNSGASSKYKTMSTDEICEVPIREHSEKDSVLFLWCTTPLIQEGFRVMEEWGFRYKTMIVWIKESKDMDITGWGFWFRTATEMLLVGVKGKVEAFHSLRTNVIRHQKMGHSVKPDIFRKIIEESTTQFGRGMSSVLGIKSKKKPLKSKKRKMIELYARTHPNKKEYKRKWDYYGDQYH